MTTARTAHDLTAHTLALAFAEEAAQLSDAHGDGDIDAADYDLSMRQLAATAYSMATTFTATDEDAQGFMAAANLTGWV